LAAINFKTTVMHRTTSAVIALTGDVGTCHGNAASMFQHVQTTLHACDIGFCQLEPVLTRRGEAVPQARLPMRAPPESALAIRGAGFTVVSCAGNHCMDFGATGLRDTLDALTAAGVRCLGAGENIAAARNPVITELGDVRTAFLAYSSILPMNCWADERRAGCAPLRAWTRYEQIEHDQPGTPARVQSFVNRDDLAAMCADIASAREQADHVIVSMHWGLHFVPGELAEYQREYAYAAIDAGATLIVGHHPHVLKGIEIYCGKPIFYSLGNFALDPPTAFASDLRDSKGFKEIEKLASGWDKEKLLPPDTFLSALVRCQLTKTGIEAVKLLPVHINAACEPTLPSAESAEFAKIVEYLDWTCRSQSLPVPYSRQGSALLLQL
jgi:hypothetical protein